MTTFTISTSNTPKHLVTLGRSQPRRMSQRDYSSIAERVASRVERYVSLGSSYFRIVPILTSRETFGDIDFVLDLSKASGNWAERMASRAFENCFYKQIGDSNTWVFEYAGYQINVHVAPISNSHSVVEYLRFGGVGPLLEIMLEDLGLVVHKYFPAIPTGIKSKPFIEMDYDIHYALTILLGYSGEYFAYDIRNEQQLFQAIQTCRYFNRASYLAYANAHPEKLIQVPMLKKFIDYLTSNTQSTRESCFIKESDTHKVWVNNFRKQYPNEVKKIVDIKEQESVSKLVHSKLNIDLVKTWTEITDDKVANEIMLKFINSFKDADNLKHHLITSMLPTIKSSILELVPAATPVLADVVNEVVVEETPVLPPAIEKKVKSSTRKKASKKVEVSEPSAKKKLPKAIPVLDYETVSQ